MRAGPRSQQTWTRSPVLLRASASSLQNGDPGEPGELSCCAFQSELRGLAEDFRWSFTDHSVIQQPLLYVLKVSPELWAAPAAPPLTQNRVPTTRGSPRRTGPRDRSGSTRTPLFSCQWGFLPCPSPGPPEALLCPARPLCSSLEALPTPPPGWIACEPQGAPPNPSLHGAPGRAPQTRLGRVSRPLAAFLWTCSSLPNIRDPPPCHL